MHPVSPVQDSESPTVTLHNSVTSTSRYAPAERALEAKRELGALAHVDQDAPLENIAADYSVDILALETAGGRLDHRRVDVLTMRQPDPDRIKAARYPLRRWGVYPNCANGV